MLKDQEYITGIIDYCKFKHKLFFIITTYTNWNWSRSFVNPRKTLRLFHSFPFRIYSRPNSRKKRQRITHNRLICSTLKLYSLWQRFCFMNNFVLGSHSLISEFNYINSEILQLLEGDEDFEKNWKGFHI